jgi:hypothetical protein
MTKSESRELGELSTVMTNFIENFNEFKKTTEKSHNLLHAKIDEGQKTDYLTFQSIKDEIYNDKKGIRVRITSLEKTRVNINKMITLVGISSALWAIVMAYKDKIIYFLFK